MALSNPTSLAAAVTSSTEVAMTSAAFTPAASSLVVVLVSAFTASGTAAITYTITDTIGGLTWTKVEATNGTSGNVTTQTIFYAVAGATPPSGTVTVTPSGSGVASFGSYMQPYQITGQASTPVGATGTSTTGTVSLSAAPASTSLVLSGNSTGVGSVPTITVPTGSTALYNAVHAGTYEYASAAYTNGSGTQSNAYGGTANPATAAIEVKASTGSSVVTVTNPGSQSSVRGSAITPLNITASTTSGTISSYSATGLPTGLSINSSTGQITGTPTTAGTYTPSVTATDSNSSTGSTSFTWTIFAPSSRPWPAVSVKVAFTPGTFTETTLGVTGPGAAEAFDFHHGRQYELARTEAGLGSLTLDNRDGRYVPTNASSPYAGNLQLYREMQVQATWSGTTYNVMHGYIERWPTTYSANGNFSEITTPTVDLFALLAGQTMRSVADYEVLKDGPTYLYKLDEPSTSTTAGDSVSPSVNGPAYRSDGKFGAGTLSFGQASGLADGATGVAFGPTSGVSGNVSVLKIPTTIPSNGAFSLEYVLKVPSTVPTNDQIFAYFVGNDYNKGYIVGYLENGTGNMIFLLQDGDGTVAGLQVNNACDGKTHHLLVTLNAARTLADAYWDGVDLGGSVPAKALVLPNYTNNLIGGRIANGVYAGNQFVGTIARAAMYPTALTATRAAAHSTAALAAFSGEDSGARINRLLGYAGIPSGMIDTGTGTSIMGAALVEGKSALEAIQSVADDELGNLWVNGAGVVKFRGRQVRQSTTTSSLTFGENTSAGELPFDSTVAFDFDPTYVIDTQTVSRTGGVTVTAQAASTVLPFHKSGPARTLEVLNDYEAIDQANWLIAQYAVPKQRVASLTVIPSENPNLWPAALGTDINTRVTVKRRALNQPAISIDCWVEDVEHRVVADQWLTTFLLSPVDSPRVALWDVDNWDDTNAVWGF